jgi:predicted dehydrogenase
MWRGILLATLAGAAAGGEPMDQVRLITLDPGHFHAALIQKEMYPWVSKRVAVYAPLGPELVDYLNRVALFNTRAENPTAWELEVHASGDFLERMLAERAGNVVVMSGRNRGKIERIQASLEAGLHVLADKPWIIASSDLGKLEAALETAERKGLVGYDIMTERYEITSMLQRVLVNDSSVFGRPVAGTGEAPGVKARSVHCIMKLVAGAPIRRPVSFFDIEEQGEGLSDVGTHVVDLVQWTLLPDEQVDYRKDIRVLDGRRWPTVIGKEGFQRVTGAADFSAALARHVKGGQLEYYCNNFVHYTLRGIHVALDIRWDWEAAPGAGDVYEASFRGTKARVEIRQGAEEKHRPELYVVPNGAAERAEVMAALKSKVAALQGEYPGVGLRETENQAQVVIPDRYRVGHEAHFAQVTNRFFEYLKAPKSLPAWEKSYMLAKYYVSTRGVELAGASPARGAGRAAGRE